MKKTKDTKKLTKKRFQHYFKSRQLNLNQRQTLIQNVLRLQKKNNLNLKQQFV